ncbi:MAG: phosphatase PAP2 family protein [Planctomycetota bacterium]|nr:phosphatase PAP2 family protein [Planctomycetota bacterium]
MTDTGERARNGGLGARTGTDGRQSCRLAGPFSCLTPLRVTLAACFLIAGGDEGTAAFFRTFRASHPFAADVFPRFSRYGNIPFYAIYAHIFYRTARRRRTIELRFVLCHLATPIMLLLVVDAVKIWGGRPRPGVAGECVPLTLDRAQHSFPPNHMTETIFIVTALGRRFGNRPFSAACGLWAVAMGLAKLCLGRHHPTDLLASAVLGSFGAYMAWRFSAPGPERSPAAAVSCLRACRQINLNATL